MKAKARRIVQWECSVCERQYLNKFAADSCCTCNDCRKQCPYHRARCDACAKKFELSAIERAIAELRMKKRKLAKTTGAIK